MSENQSIQNPTRTVLTGLLHILPVLVTVLLFVVQWASGILQSDTVARFAGDLARSFPTYFVVCGIGGAVVDVIGLVKKEKPVIKILLLLLAILYVAIGVFFLRFSIR